MCACYHKIHWSVISILVSAVAVVLYTSAVASNKWARRSYTNKTTYDVNLGLFRACSELNNTCSNTHVRFDGVKQKGALMASAIIHVFALIGMWFFLVMSVLYLCGLFDDDHLVNVSILMSYVSGLLSIMGLLMYIGSVIPLGYSLNWSTMLAAAGCCINIAAGVLMCAGQKRSRKKMKKKKKNKTKSGTKSRGPVEEIQMQEPAMMGNPVWSTGGQHG